MLHALQAGVADTWRSLTNGMSLHHLGCSSLAATKSALTAHQRSRMRYGSNSKSYFGQHTSLLSTRRSINASSTNAVRFATGQPAPATGFHREHELGDGSNLTIRLLTAAELEATTDLLVETYFSTYNFGPYKRYLMGQVRKYLRDHMKLLPDAVVLVALLDEAGASSSAAVDPQQWSRSSGSSLEQQDLSPALLSDQPDAADGSSSSSSAATRRVRYPLSSSNESRQAADSVPRVVGAAEVSFTQSARSRYPSLNPPPETAFLTNMAVDETVRRRGIGTKLLQAAVDVTALSNRQELFLHVRLQDVPARQLYAKHGFRLAEEDCVLVWLLGRDRKQLLCKFLDEE